MAITISNLRINPYSQKDAYKPIFGDKLTLAFSISGHQTGDTYEIGFDHQKLVYPPSRPLCAGTTTFTLSEENTVLTFEVNFTTSRMRDWVNTLKKPTPIYFQVVRIRSNKATTLVLDDLLALPSVIDGAITVAEGDPIKELLSAKLDKPATEGITNQILSLDANGQNVWRDEQSLSGYATKEYVDEEVSEAKEEAETALESHEDDSTAHNALFAVKANTSDLQAHTSDSTIHVTSSEKTNWNAKADVSDIPTKVSDLTNDSGYQTASDVATAISGKQDTITTTGVLAGTGNGNLRTVTYGDGIAFGHTTDTARCFVTTNYGSVFCKFVPDETQTDAIPYVDYDFQTTSTYIDAIRYTTDGFVCVKGGEVVTGESVTRDAEGDVAPHSTISLNADTVASLHLADNSVQKVSGKGLSTNDYTDAEKTKLAGIAEGAEVNVQADWDESDSSDDAFIKNKPTISTVNDATITLTQGGVTKGSFTTNQGTAATIELDAGGGSDPDVEDALDDLDDMIIEHFVSTDTNDYFHITSLVDDNEITLGSFNSSAVMQLSIDRKNWISVSGLYNKKYILNENEKMWFRGDNDNQVVNGNLIISTGNLSVGGNMASLWKKDMTVSTYSSNPNAYAALTGNKITSLETGFRLPTNATRLIKYFYQASSLSSIPSDFTIPDTATSLQEMFRQTALTTIDLTIPSGITDAVYMFDSCSSLTTANITFPSSFSNSISISRMFSNCAKLETLGDNFIIPSGVTNIDNLFSYCSKLTKLNDGFTIPSTVTVQGGAFSGNTKITTFGDNVQFLSNVAWTDGNYPINYVTTIGNNFKLRNTTVTETDPYVLFPNLTSLGTNCDINGTITNPA